MFDEERLRQSHWIDICVKRAIDIDDTIYVFGKNAQHHYFWYELDFEVRISAWPDRFRMLLHRS